jgi:catechol 2,3-dioxygenase-like lactoylglutathione lyase family enzyme
MINGAHAIVYSTDAEADRAFLRDVLGLTHVDAGHGWLIFGLPPAEVAVHPGERNDAHELYFMCDDVEAFVAGLSARGVTCSLVQDRGWGRLTSVSLPGGGKLGVYEPRHARPPATMPTKKPTKTVTRKVTKKVTKRSTKPQTSKARPTSAKRGPAKATPKRGSKPRR